METKTYPLEIENVGEDTYIVMSRGHHDLTEFMSAAIAQYPDWQLGGPCHVWVKTTPGRGTYDKMYNFVSEGARGAWPATYCFEYGEDYKKWNAQQQVKP